MRNNATIFLVGPMGSGKTAVGRQLAVRLGRAFVDVDDDIEARAGKPITAIFADEGEAGFRVRESHALADALSKPAQVIATGGGAVLDEANRAALGSAGIVVYLRIDPREQLIRIAGNTRRPLLDVADPGQRLAELQAQREPLYREVADLVFDTNGHTPDSAADALAAMVSTSLERTT